MIIEQTILPFWSWIGPIVRDWLVAFGLLLVTAFVVGFVFSAARNGIVASFLNIGKSFARAVEDFLFLSPSRTWAIARLTIKESLRRRVLSICAVFLVILMFAGWYLNPDNPDPAKLYLSFVLSATCYLMLLLALFLSSFSLPTDFKTKTIYTVVTKPVRASEMVLGRMVGVTIVGTLLLLFMSIMSYFFVTQTLNHNHILSMEDMTEVSVASGMRADDPSRVVLKGATRLSSGHKHEVEIRADGSYVVETVNGHTHDIDIEKTDGNDTATERFTVLPARGMIQARVPIYGELTFRGKNGYDAQKGINVGDEWEYRSFIGGTGGTIFSNENKNDEAAFWTMSGITERKFPDGLPVEMTLGIYRTHKGDVEKRISANISLRNPKTGLFVDITPFSTEEFVKKSVFIPREVDSTFSEILQRRYRDTITGREVKVPSDDDMVNYSSLAGKDKYDIFEDLVDNGTVEIWLSCTDSQQYIGVARVDLYVRARDASVEFNFIKGFFGIWQQMVLVIAYGVVFSTFLSGPVTMVSTLGIMITGFFKSYLINIGLGQELGGGPFESFLRLIWQMNQVEELPSGSYVAPFIQAADYVYGAFLALFGQAIPPLSDYYIYYTALASGFDVPIGLILQNVLTTLSYLLPLFIIGYLILSNREVAK